MTLICADFSSELLGCRRTEDAVDEEVDEEGAEDEQLFGFGIPGQSLAHSPLPLPRKKSIMKKIEKIS